jgi:hypothetical protein
MLRLTRKNAFFARRVRNLSSVHDFGEIDFAKGWVPYGAREPSSHYVQIG